MASPAEFRVEQALRWRKAVAQPAPTDANERAGQGLQGATAAAAAAAAGGGAVDEAAAAAAAPWGAQQPAPLLAQPEQQQQQQQQQLWQDKEQDKEQAGGPLNQASSGGSEQFTEQRQPHHHQHPAGQAGSEDSEATEGHMREEGEAPTCYHCGTDSTSGWRRHPTSRERLCRACWAHMRSHNGELPPLGVQCLQCSGTSPGQHHGAIWRPHPGTGERWLCSPCFYEARREADQRQCLECGAATPGAAKSSNWRRHPVTGAEWLCKKCHARAYEQKKRQQGVRRRRGDGKQQQQQQQQAEEQQQVEAAAEAQLQGGERVQSVHSAPTAGPHQDQLEQEQDEEQSQQMVAMDEAAEPPVQESPVHDSTHQQPAKRQRQTTEQRQGMLQAQLPNAAIPNGHQQPPPAGSEAVSGFAHALPAASADVGPAAGSGLVVLAYPHEQQRSSSSSLRHPHCGHSGSWQTHLFSCWKQRSRTSSGSCCRLLKPQLQQRLA